MNTNNTRIFSIMTIVFWIVFIGLLIQAGSCLIAFIVSFTNPELANALYLGENVSPFESPNDYKYTSFFVAFALIKAYMAYLVIQVFLKLDLQQPFTERVAKLVHSISHVALGAGVLAMIAQGYAKWLAKTGVEVVHHWGSAQFLFLAGIIYVIALIFKRGVALQTENELTI